MKYLIMDNCGPLADIEAPFIFSELDDHRHVAERLGGAEHVVGAGFCDFIGVDEQSITVICYGESVSLKIKSREKADEKLIKSFVSSSRY